MRENGHFYLILFNFRPYEEGGLHILQKTRKNAQKLHKF
jgi:hypothetical protein